MTTRGVINSNFYQIVNVDGDGAPTDIKPQYIGNVGNANYANFANVANVANSVNVANVVGIGNIATINLTNSTSNVLYGNGVFAGISAGANANYANFAGQVVNATQSNITSLGTLTTLNVSSAVNATSFTSNVAIGTAPFVVTSTTQVANLNVAQSNYANTANAVAGANVSGSVAQANIANTANAVAGANVSGTVANANYASYAGNAFSVDVANVVGIGNIATINLDGNAGNILYGNGVFSAVPDVGNANSANFANYANFVGQVIDATQSNITTVGTLTNLNVSGDSNLGNLAVANFFSGDGGLLSNISGANVGNVANANYANYAGNAFAVDGANVSGQVGNALVAGTVYTAAQPNITSTGTLTGLNVSSAVNATSFTSNVAIGTAPFSVISTTEVANLNVAQSNFANTANAVAGANVSGQVANALVAGTVYTAAQGNITSVGSLTGLTVSNATGVVNFTTTANVTLGSVSNLHISGGTIGQVLTTDGSGSLSFATVASGGNVPGGSNTYGQFNDGGSFGGVAGFTFDKVSNILTATNIAGNGSGLTSITGANVSGQVGNALVAGTVYTAAQPNITSTGTLTSLNVSSAVNATSFTSNVAIGTAPFTVISTTEVANLNVAQSNFANTANAVAGGNVSGQVANALVAGTVYTNAQPNITSVGSLTGLVVSNATGVVDFTTSANVTLGAVSNLHISGGTNGYVLSTDGSSTLSWVAQSGGGGTPGGSNTYGQFNDGGSFGGVAAFTFDKVSNILTATNIAGNGSGLTSLAGANVTGQVGNALVSGTVYTNAQPNITSVGSLTGLTVSNATGVVNFTTTANVTLGDVANLHISGGTNGYVLSTDGLGVLSWIAGGGGGSPGGSNTYVQFNDASTFGGNASLTFDKTTGTLSTANLTVTNTASPANLVTVKYNEGVIAGGSTGAATITPNAAAGTIYNYTLTGNITLSALTNAVAGTGMTIILTQDGTGNRLLTSTMKFLGGVKTLSTAASTIDIMSVFYDGTTYYATLGKGFA